MCWAVVGIVRKWLTGQDVIRVTMCVKANFIDGKGDYPAGIITDVFYMTLTL